MALIKFILSLFRKLLELILFQREKKERVVELKNPEESYPTPKSKGLCAYCHRPVYVEIPFYTGDTREPLHDHCASKYLDQGKPVVKGRA